MSDEFLQQLQGYGAHVGPGLWGDCVLNFGNSEQEYQAIHSGCALIPVIDRTQVELAGDDRAKLLHNLCTNNINALAAGQGCEAFITDVQGKTLEHVYVFQGPDALVLDTVPGRGEALVKHFDRYIIREKVTPCDRSADWADLLLAGPGAEGLLEKLAPAEHFTPSELFAHGPWTGSGRLEGEPTCWLRRVDWVSPADFLISVPREQLSAVWQLLSQEGAVPGGETALNQARLERGTPWSGIDLTEKNLPQEVDRNRRAISFTKGCYLGQETVARIDALGHVNKLLRGVAFPGSEIPASGTEIVSEDKVVGRVTSAVFSPALQKPLAFCYLKRGFHKPGLKIAASLGEVEVVELPLGS